LRHVGVRCKLLVLGSSIEISLEIFFNHTRICDCVNGSTSYVWRFRGSYLSDLPKEERPARPLGYRVRYQAASESISRERLGRGFNGGQILHGRELKREMYV
jgi:hypothetical protein